MWKALHETSIFAGWTNAYMLNREDIFCVPSHVIDVNDAWRWKVVLKLYGEVVSKLMGVTTARN